MDTLAKGIQQLQELQAQALARSATSSTSMELVKHGTMTLAALPDMKVGCEAALDFQDWLEVAATSLSDLSEQSGEWWRAVIASTEETYRKWLAATPLERLSLAPDNTEALTSGRWQRLNARVSALLLSAMGVDLRADMISQRISQDAVKMTYRLYTWFQPGGSDEREDVLRRLQNPQEYVPYSTVQDALKALRAWPRWLARCKAVGMAAPDPSVLARGLKGITQAHIDKSGDASFRTSMVRTTLRLDAQPTVDQVLAYQRHLQAELETMAAGKTTTSPTTSPPKLRAIEKGSAKGKGKDGDKEKAVEMCKYFLKASGCKRGSRCVYSHSMQNLDRDIRARKCLSCGSESHRQRECPVNKPTSKAGAPSPSGGKGGKPDKAQEGTTSSTTSTAPTVAAMHGSTTSSSQVVEGTPWTLEALVQAAHQVVQQQQGTSSAREGDSSPEKTRADLKTLVVKDIRVCSLQSMSMALLDSGATPCLRRATTSSEWNGAEQVMVQLAGTHTLLMRMSDTGTLLMPPRAESSSSEASSPGAGQTIVPIGQLVQTLGYSLHWTPGSCYLVDAEGVKIPLKVKSGCPQLQEVEALALIARIEERRKECLENQTLVLQDKIECASLVMEKTWEDHLRVYAQNGYMGDGLRALRDAPFLEDLPMECLSGLVPADVQESGWEILKWISFLNRSQRRRMLMAKRWVIHLFAGEPGHYEMFKLDQHGTVVLELDVHRCRGQDIYRPEVWRMLMWGARMGKIDVIMGGPPGRHKGSFGHDGVLPDDLRPLSAITRMTWLHAVAEAGRLVHGATCEKRRPVGFVVEHPEHEVDVVGHPLGTCSRTDSLWTTTVWRVYSEVGGLRAASFDQGPMGSSTRNPTTLGTNVDHLLSLHELRQQPEQDDQVRGTTPPHVWSPGLVRALVVALTFWDRGRRQYPMVRAMTPEQWKAHVASNHEHYRRDCVTCVMARGTGQRHMKVKHPDSYVLTTDLAGPVRAGLDPTSKGKMGKGLKYMLVAKYIVPKEFMKGRVNKEPPDDLGAPPSSSGLSTKEKELEQAMIREASKVKINWLLIARSEDAVNPNTNVIDEEETLDYEPSYAGLHDPGLPEEELVVGARPKRRLKEKTPFEDVELRRVHVSEEEVVTMAVTTAAQYLDAWDHEEARQLVINLADRGFFDDRKFGVFRHGGTIGWMTGFEQFPDLSRLLARLVLEVEPTATFTSIWVSHNSQRPLHQDLNNDEWTYNYVIPLQCPQEGGELWTELRPGDRVCGPISMRPVGGDRQVYGQEHSLQVGKCICFSPRRLHEVREWKGSRTMLIAYPPQCLGKLNYKDIKTLDEHGFPPPLSQLPEAFGGQPQAYLSAMEPHEQQSLNSMPLPSLNELVFPELEEEDWEVYLDLEDGEVMLGGEFGLNIDGVRPQVAKTEVSYTANVEQILQQLTSPLEVTYTVDPREVLQSLPLWEPAIRKEVGGVEIAIQRLLPDTAERSAWLSKPGIQRLPTKFVFTVKPNDKAIPTDPTTWWKRKARLVACGNYAQSDGSNRSNLYAESAPAEAVRAGLTLTCKQSWEVGIIDVIAAFLKTPIGRKATDPKIVVAPPKLLEKLGITVPLELWGLVRALYGLRQSPALWSDYRDDMIAQLRLPDGLRLLQGQTVRCWWSVIDKNGTTVGVLIVYVDDFMLCGSRPVVELLSKAIREMWETSELSILSSSNPIRFLGMELAMVPQEENAIYVSQYGYIQELLRHHDLPETRLDKVPVSKELSSFSVEPTDVAADDYMVHQTQQVTGEILWVSQRSRPDLSYTSALMSTLTTRAPYRVVEIGLKALGYLRRTAKYQLRVSWSEAPLTMFCDAAYAPQSERSHAGWLVAYGQVPLVWRSSRQQMITLSTAEAELLALTDGAVALKGVECLLADLGERVTSRELASDSSAIQEEIAKIEEGYCDVLTSTSYDERGILSSAEYAYRGWTRRSW
ncbi:Copia protein [Symbiodinium microadriaticum]|uniref:Copia protein n=1 Tax=Symbiodinium microadriaticum TaxID=2951 RepID=A0A1Q9C4D4_SYMMI|nr:Copia protein [Symbiodinium microadriaticum]